MNEKIFLWENPPYIADSSDGFRASVTEFRICDSKTAVIVCPGGGYEFKADHEGVPIAKMLNENGINAFVLDYSVKKCNKYAPLSDVLRSIRKVRSLGYEKVAVLGFSAGGHLVCSAGIHYDFDAYPKQDKIDDLSARPDAFIPCYPVVTFGEFTHWGSRVALLGDEYNDDKLIDFFSNEKHVTKNTPPCFIWHTRNDNAVPSQNAFMLADALLKNGVYFEMHIYPNGWHGLGLATEYNDIKLWSKSCVEFLKNLNF